MKLFCCLTCKQVENFRIGSYIECCGGHGGGKCLNEVEVAVWGSREGVHVLALANSSLADAIQAQIREGDSGAKMRYAGEWVTRGRHFDGFVVPEDSDTVHRFQSKDEFLRVHGPLPRRDHDRLRSR